MNETLSDVPTITKFDPVIPYQRKVIYDIRKNFDYTMGTHQILLSGAVGSAKSLLMAHIICTHCLLFDYAAAGIGRLTMPDLKDTLLQMILEHLGEDVEFEYNQTRSQITFMNRSTIKAFSWHDKKYSKFRSHKFSLFAIEELTENHTADAYNAIMSRMGRMPHVREKVLISATNPDSPAHWAYKRLIERANHKIHIYYSCTKDNPFLPKSYINDLLENYTAKEIERLVYGKWIEIKGDSIYYAYDHEHNFINESYEVDPSLPIALSWDFNIADSKPMSLVCAQEREGAYHFFNKVVIHGARTEDTLEELLAKGILDYKTTYLIHGDATGKHNDTRSKRSDYDIIKQFLANTKNNNGEIINFEMCVPLANPPVRTRHNIVNGKCNNAHGKRNFFVYKDCKELDEGMRLTKLKDNGNYIEDDSFPMQHITTAAGYYIVQNEKKKRAGKQGTVLL